MSDSLWIAKTPLILASGSATRRDLLVKAGIPVDVRPAQIDERLVDADARAEGASPIFIATLLAKAKAIDVSDSNPGRIVLGADQTLECEGRQFNKPSDTEDGKSHLRVFSGQTHVLHSAAVVVKDGQVLSETLSSARMTMRAMSEAFICAYVERVGPHVMTSVGGYQMEGIGSQLFEKIEGDHFTILGLPLLPLMRDLRKLGYLAE